MTNNDYKNDYNHDQLPALQLSAVEQVAHDLTASIIQLTDQGCVNLGNVFERIERPQYVLANNMLRKAVTIEQSPVADNVTDIQAYNAEQARRVIDDNALPGSEGRPDVAA